MTNYGTFAGLELEDYVTEVDGLREDKAKAQKVAELDKIISEMLESALPVERLPLLRLEQQRIALEYPLLDLSFLSMSNDVQINGKSTPLPRFGIYRYFQFTSRPFNPNPNPNRFSIYYRLSSSAVVEFGMGNEPVSDFIVKSFIGAVFPGEQIVGKDCEGRHVVSLPREKFGEYQHLHNMQVYSEFNGLIPLETKQKVERSKILFGNEVYIIGEIKPEDWNVQVMPKDPLIIGIKEHDKVYLVDHFNTTPLENYVSQEFIHGSDKDKR